MPYKLRNNRRHKSAKLKYKITNWPKYNEALINRGAVTLWLSQEIIKAWYPKKYNTKLRGGQLKYSDVAIEAAIIIKTVYSLPYRGTQGFLGSIMELMKIKLDVPNYSRICRRAATLELPELKNIGNEKNINIVIDSTGLKIFGAGQWHEEKHGLKKRREWRKLHLTIDRDSHAIIAQELTTLHEDDASQVTSMFKNIEQNITHTSADSAYDKSQVYNAILAKGGKDVTIAIMPRKDAIVHDELQEQYGARNHNVEFINEQGYYRWQDSSDYNYRALGETAMFRYKTIIGDSLYSRNFTSQKVEAKTACHVLNKMTALGMPRSVKIRMAA